MADVGKTAQKCRDIDLWVCPSRGDSASRIVFYGPGLEIVWKRSEKAVSSAVGRRCVRTCDEYINAAF